MSNSELHAAEHDPDLVERVIRKDSTSGHEYCDAYVFMRRFSDAIARAGCTKMSVSDAPYLAAAEHFIFLGVPASRWSHAVTTLHEAGIFRDDENAVFLTPLNSLGRSNGESYRLAIEIMLEHGELSQDILVPMRESLTCLHIARTYQPYFVEEGSRQEPGYMAVLVELSNMIVKDEEVAEILLSRLVTPKEIVMQLEASRNGNKLPKLSEGSLGSAALKQCLNIESLYVRTYGLMHGFFNLCRTNRDIVGVEFEKFLKDVKPRCFNWLFTVTSDFSMPEDPEFSQCVMQGLFSPAHLENEKNPARRMFTQLPLEFREGALQFMLPDVAKHNPDAISDIVRQDFGGDCLVYRDTVAAVTS